MGRHYQPIDPARLRTYAIGARKHKSGVSEIASLPAVGATGKALIDSMPDYLGAQSFRSVVTAMVQAVRHGRPVVMAFGAHVIKVGCSPIVIDLIERGIVTGICGNGACAIHDAELASFGETSEEVADTIRDGTFGMVQETLDLFAEMIEIAQRDGIGLGEAVGLRLNQGDMPHVKNSIFAAAHRHGIPACVHVAVGTDTVHVSPGVDGAKLGRATMHDFRLVCDVVGDLGAAEGGDVGGVWLNVGSAVLLPEVFLKAVAVARNLGANLDLMTTGNLDMIRHYRPHANVVTRPVAAGRGFEVVGHHEILLPLLRQAVIEALAESA